MPISVSVRSDEKKQQFMDAVLGLHIHGEASCLGSPLFRYKRFLFLSGSSLEGLEKIHILRTFFLTYHFIYYMNTVHHIK